MINLTNLLPENIASETARDHTFPLKLTIDSALCIGAGGTTGSLADKAIVRNAEGNLVIPGSHLKGRLRHESEKLACSLDWWVAEAPDPAALSATVPPEFGHHGGTGSPYQVAGYPGYHCAISQIFGDPILPSRLLLDDLVCEYSPDMLAATTRPGVSINRRRRTAEEKKLFFLETSPANVQLPFKGELHLLAGAPPYTLGLVTAALRQIYALGGSKSAGLGWLTWQQVPAIPADYDWTCLQAPSAS
ncbi:MAG: RAMP superfamily CRISPR-associated protein [Cyanobacteria bacterium P01_H01_bin.21]